MMRILHFVSVPATWSGVMSVLMNLYRHIDRTRFQFDFLCFLQTESNYEEEIRSLGGQVFYLPRPGASLTFFGDYDRFFREHAADYSWLENHEVYLSFYLERLARKHRIPHFAVHAHATRYADRGPSELRNRILCLPIRSMRCIRIACSEAAGRFLYGEEAVTAGAVTVIRNAVETDRYAYDGTLREQLREKEGLAGHIVIGHVGRFLPQKNHAFLIDCFAAYAAQHPEAVLLLIGEGDLQEEIRRKVRDQGLEKQVRFLGRQTEVRNWYQVMDQFWMPSLYEGLPLSAVEAQAAGLPALLADTITEECRIHPHTRFLSLKAGPRDWAAAAEALTPACQEYERSEGRQDAARAGFDIRQEVRRLEALYQEES